MADETAILTGELLEMDDDEFELDERLDLGDEHRVDNEADHLPEDTLGSGETGEITNVRYPASANEGDRFEVLTDVKSTGDKTCEFRVFLKNPEGKTIDVQPAPYKSVKPGETATIKTTMPWGGRWSMPAYDWNLRVELWDIDLLNPDDLLHTRNFTVKLAKAKEAGMITNMQYPASLKKGQDFDITATIKNTGTRTSQYRLFLRDPAGKTIDSNTVAVTVKPGYTGTIKLTTGGWTKLGWKMPAYDWNLSLVLYDVDLLSFKDRLHSRTFTIKLRSDGVTPPPGPVCVEGEVVGDMICRGGVYVPIGAEPCSPEGAYDATGTKICSGGVWVTVGEEPGAGCTVEGAYSADGTMICSAGAWVPVSVPGTGCTTEGAYSADGTMICRGGVWVDVEEGNGVRKYITVEEANERVRLGLPCYIKFVLPILDLIPGLPYFAGCPILPGFAITEKP